MFLHLGQDTVVSTASIVGIFDLDNTSYSAITRSFLKSSSEKKHVYNVSEELPKSFVLTCENGETRVYISQISTATLLKRAESGRFEDL